jgi:thiamine pyrophosphate-dependent acetolactate synthase large subunit-like protein
VHVDRDADFESALRTALGADRSTVIQVTLDKAWLTIEQPPG